MSVWIFIWLMFILKIPIIGLFLIVRWAVGQTPETAPGTDGGSGMRVEPVRPRHPRPRPPRPPRRGPHGEAPPRPPARVRGLSSRRRTVRG